MYIVKRKKIGNNNYKTINKFKEYKKAYYFVGDYLQKNDSLHWSYSLKYLMDGYDRKKIFIFGDKYLRRKNICYKIEQLS